MCEAAISKLQEKAGILARNSHACDSWLDVSFFSHVKTIVHSSDWLELICVSKFTTQLFCEHFSAASYPDVSLSMKMCAQRKAGRSQQTRRRFACRLYPFHGPLRSVTSRSSTLRKTKRPRRRLIAQYVYNKKQIKEEARVKVENYLKSGRLSLI